MPLSLPEFLDQVHRRISVMLKGLLAIGALLLLIGEQYQAGMETLAILVITFMPLLLPNRYKVHVPYEFESLAILFLHAWSGFLLGITGFVLVYVLNENQNINFDLSPGFIALFACLFGIGMGTMWEIFEYVMDQSFGLNMQKSGLHDTMWDLIVDTLGAMVISILGYRYLQTHETDSFLERWIDRFIESNPRLFRKQLGLDDDAA